MKTKAYILNLGNMYSDSNYTVFADTYANVANPHAVHRMLHIPCIAVLISHPKDGWILFDTGLADCPQEVWPDSISSGIIVDKPDYTHMDRQLELVGVRPADIKFVISSHLHMDHTGNDRLFADTAEYFMSKADAELAYRMVLHSPNPNTHGYYIKSDVLLARKKVTYIDQDTELFTGVEVVMLPGHTPGVLGLVLHLESRTLIFPSDAVGEQRNYEGMLPGVMYDSLGYVESLRKLKNLQRKYNADIIFSHDTNQFKMLKLAPDFYD